MGALEMRRWDCWNSNSFSVCAEFQWMQIMLELLQLGGAVDPLPGKSSEALVLEFQLFQEWR
jgi:hypothetical protein